MNFTSNSESRIISLANLYPHSDFKSSHVNLSIASRVYILGVVDSNIFRA
jgi:hypothetical protein